MNRLPPLLMGAALLFWGWQANFWLMGALLAVLAEGARVTRVRWELTDEDLNRLWNLTTLFFITSAVIAFTMNDGPEALGRLFDDQGLAASRAAGETSQRTAASLIQWFPMVFALFALAHTLSRRGPLPLPVFSLVWRRPKLRGEPSPLAERHIDVGWIYFALCLAAASINTNSGAGFYLGASGLLAWALWSQRSPRFRWWSWAAVLVVAGGLGFIGQDRLAELRRVLENWAPQFAWRPTARRTSPDHVYTSLGQIGRIKDSGRIVMRVAAKDGTPMPELLRTASYRFYRSPAWGAGNRSETPDRPSIGVVQPEAGGINYILRQTNSLGRITVTTPLDVGADLLPLPLGATRLENLIANTLKTNTLGAAIIDGPSLVIYDTLFGVGGSIDSPPTEADRAIPEREKAALESVLPELKLNGLSDSQKLRVVAAWFQDNFTYRTWQPESLRLNADLTALQWFLAPTNRAGHCEYFATATTLLLRQLGYPTRYAVGWSVQEVTGDEFVIRERHAHAWCLVYYGGQWHDYDTTPASWLALENQRASKLQALSDLWSWVKFEFLKWRAGQSSLRRYLWWIIGPMLLFLLYRLMRRRPGGKLHYPGGLEGELVRLGLDSEFYQLERQLKQFGLVRQPSETLAEFLDRAQQHERLGGLAEPLQILLRLHYQLRFDPVGLDAPGRQSLREGVRDALARLAEKPA
jgi:hypothetical protein